MHRYRLFVQQMVGRQFGRHVKVERIRDAQISTQPMTIKWSKLARQTGCYLAVYYCVTELVSGGALDFFREL
jgi:hypothetical protein